MIKSQNKIERIAGLRREYNGRTLEGDRLEKNPFNQFENWFEDALTADFTEGLEGMQISRPEFWGGFRVKPIMFEFWQGRKSRLHDRARYLKREESIWQMIRLAP